ncbi:hypothetical protein A6A06_14815 [Streptomyces sp. CB02923]|nr:hypothetical protein A6A06_14815 [Streptomyces sp. CB02923]
MLRRCIIPLQRRDETPSACLWDVRVCCSLILVILFIWWVSATVQCPVHIVGPLLVMLLVASCCSGMRFVRLRRG